MSQTITERSIVASTSDSNTPTEEDRQDTQERRPQEEFEFEDEANTSTTEDESQYPTGRKFQIILLSISLVLIASDVSTIITPKSADKIDYWANDYYPYRRAVHPAMTLTNA